MNDDYDSIPKSMLKFKNLRAGDKENQPSNLTQKIEFMKQDLDRKSKQFKEQTRTAQEWMELTAQEESQAKQHQVEHMTEPNEHTPEKEHNEDEWTKVKAKRKATRWDMTQSSRKRTNNIFDILDQDSDEERDEEADDIEECSPTQPMYQDGPFGEELPDLMEVNTHEHMETIGEATSDEEKEDDPDEHGDKIEVTVTRRPRVTPERAQQEGPSLEEAAMEEITQSPEMMEWMAKVNVDSNTSVQVPGRDVRLSPGQFDWWVNNPDTVTYWHQQGLDWNIIRTRLEMEVQKKVMNEFKRNRPAVKPTDIKNKAASTGTFKAHDEVTQDDIKRRHTHPPPSSGTAEFPGLPPAGDIKSRIDAVKAARDASRRLQATAPKQKPAKRISFEEFMKNKNQTQQRLPAPSPVGLIQKKPRQDQERHTPAEKTSKSRTTEQTPATKKPEKTQDGSIVQKDTPAPVKKWIHEHPHEVEQCILGGGDVRSLAEQEVAAQQKANDNQGFDDETIHWIQLSCTRPSQHRTTR